MIATNYFKITPVPTGAAGIFPFDASDIDSVRSAWENAHAMKDVFRRGAVRVCVWRRVPYDAKIGEREWNNADVIGVTR